MTGLKKTKDRQAMFFTWKKTNGQNKLWRIIKGSDGQFKYDIDSILDDQIKFQRGGTKLAGDLTIEEIMKTVISMKSVKYPGGDGIISYFYQFYWEGNDKDFLDVVNEMFHNFELSD